MNRLMKFGLVLMLPIASLAAGCHSHTKTVEREKVIIRDDHDRHDRGRGRYDRYDGHRRYHDDRRGYTQSGPVYAPWR